MGEEFGRYRAEAVEEQGELRDLRLLLADGKTWHLWGRDGIGRETALAGQVPEGVLPVLLGSGLGICLETLLARGPVVLMDNEQPLMDAADITARFGAHPNFHRLQGKPEQVLRALDDLRRHLGGGEVWPVVIPLYLRLASGHYKGLADRLASMGEFQRAMAYPRFATKKPRVLLLTQPYFLYAEIKAALDQLGVVHHRVDLPVTGRGDNKFIETLLAAIAEFKPDFVLTVNHFGLDRDGRLAGLFADLGLPLASWFVDSPQLILYRYPRLNTPLTTVFTYDAGSIPWLTEAGFENVHFLPLGTDPNRFAPGQEGPSAWRSEVSFVGDSMTLQVEGMIEDAGLSEEFRVALPTLAAGFVRAPEAEAVRFLVRVRPDLHAEYESLPGLERQLACEKALTFASARHYRLDCVRHLMSFQPLIAGDESWAQVLGDKGWRSAGHLDYYRDLPRFYPLSQVNFNCTSVQMKGAVNQRVFDVPACGGFLITDWRLQMEQLFDPGEEVICYHEPDDIPDMVAGWLSDAVGRASVAERARRRIRAEHTYVHRLTKLIETMRASYDTSVGHL